MYIVYLRKKTPKEAEIGMTNHGIVELDLHGMNVAQAKIAVDARLKRCGKEVYRLRLIHGFHGGSAIRDMVRKEYRNRKGVLRIEIGLNEGETDLVLRELF